MIFQVHFLLLYSSQCQLACYKHRDILHAGENWGFKDNINNSNICKNALTVCIFTVAYFKYF